MPAFQVSRGQVPGPGRPIAARCVCYKPRPMPPGRTAKPLQGSTWLVAWLAIALGTALTAHLGISSARPWQAIAAYLAAGACWAASVVLLRERAPARGLVWLGALALRLIALAGDPRTSDDVWRSVWEGGLVGAGHSPYAHAPADPVLQPYRNAWPEVAARVGHPEISAAYPPLTQSAQALAVAVAGGPAAGAGSRAVFALRLAAVLAELAGLLAFERVLARQGRSPGLAVAWAWSPLMALEFAGAAHHDALGVALCVAGLAASAAGRAAPAGALLAMAAWVKPMALATLPFAARASASSRAGHGARVLAAAVGVTALLWTPLAFLEGGASGLSRGLTEYALRWEGGNLLYRFIEPLLGLWTSYDESWSDPRRLARALLGVAWLAVLAWAWRKRRDAWSAAGMALGAWILLAPVLHPWYLAWLLPFAVAGPWTRATGTAAVALVAVAPALYAPLPGWIARREWLEPGWVWFALVGVPLAAWACERRFRRSTGNRVELPEPRA